MITRIVVTALVVACAGFALAAHGAASPGAAGAQDSTWHPDRTSAWSIADQQRFVQTCRQAGGASGQRCGCIVELASAVYPTAAAATAMPAEDREVFAATCRGR